MSETLKVVKSGLKRACTEVWDQILPKKVTIKDLLSHPKYSDRFVKIPNVWVELTDGDGEVQQNLFITENDRELVVPSTILTGRIHDVWKNEVPAVKKVPTGGLPARVIQQQYSQRGGQLQTINGRLKNLHGDRWFEIAN